ncbi:hypothetical protein GF326_11420 [Candidatus Bathyarchaeota archaeon]|nr:hypothetical protein [Candidatus Bathyarchaeota archaeon]
MDYSEIPRTRISGSSRMNIPEYGTIKISGSGSISPEKISTSGNSHIPGGLKIGSLKTSGSTRIEGDITADTIKLRGSAYIEGGVKTEEIIKSGSLIVEKNLETKYGKFSGSTKIRGAGYIERELDASGTTSFGDELVSEDKILYSGVLQVNGRVKAKSFEARLSNDESYIRDWLEANYINIQVSHSDWGNRGRLVARDITGKDITLENVECDNVTGENITILPGCHIRGKVQYSENIKVDPTSKLDNKPLKTE